jgi:DNA-binding CsgD family transcriptional regulator
MHGEEQLDGEERTAGRCHCPSGACHRTARETQILPLVAAGMSNERIARLLGISARTVDQHLTTMLRRASAANRAELVARCYAAGIMREGIWPPAWSGMRCLMVA